MICGYGAFHALVLVDEVSPLLLLILASFLSFSSSSRILLWLGREYSCRNFLFRESLDGEDQSFFERNRRVAPYWLYIENKRV
jgi:hypothetical protein